MEKKYTLNEGYESLERVKLMMGYDLSKTLNENKKHILNEDISSFPWCVRFGGVAWPSDPKNSKSKEYTSAIANASGGFDSTNATYQTFNTPFILNKETHRFFSDGTYLKKSQDGKKWIKGTYKCSNPSPTKGLGNTGSILFDNERDIMGDMDKSLTKKALGIISNPDRNRLDYLEKLKRQAGMENMLSRKEWMKPEIQQEYQELKQKLEGLFPPSGNLYGTEKPKPPQIVGQYIKSSGANTRVRWEYIRYENKEPVVYSFEDLERGGEEYRKHYEQYKKDLKQWNRDTNIIWHIIDDAHFRNQVLSMAVFFIPGLNLFATPISAAIQLYDAKLYHDEGDDFSAGLAVLFAMTPGMTLSKKQVTKIFSYLKGSKNIVLTAEEKAALELVKQQSKKTISSTFAKAIQGGLRTLLNSMGLLTYVRFLLLAKTKFPFLSNIIGTGLNVGGVMITYSALYNKISTISQKSVKSPEDQKFLADAKIATEQQKTKILEIKESELIREFQNEENAAAAVKSLAELNEKVRKKSKSVDKKINADIDFLDELKNFDFDSDEQESVK